MSVKNN